MGICLYIATIVLCYSSTTLVVVCCTAQTNNYLSHYCTSSSGNLTTSNTTGTYATNLNQLLSSLSSNVTTTNNNWWYQNISFGQYPDKVYGAFMCRADVTPQFCKTCVDSAITKLTQLCVNHRESIIYFEHCMLRYSNQSFFSVMSTKPSAYHYQCHTVNSPNTSNEVLENFLNSLVDEASASSSSRNGGSPHLFYTKEARFGSLLTIYGLVQCTPDITSPQCRDCLGVAIAQIPISSCLATLRGRKAQPSCFLQYDLHPFYQSPHSTAKGNRKNLKGTIALVIGSFLIVLICICIILLCKRNKSHNSVRHMTPEATRTDVFPDQDVEVNATTTEPLQFDFNVVRAATNDFSLANKLGEGRFGPVYKGQLSDGQNVSVRRLSRYFRLGEDEFKKEVALLAKLQDVNLVRLLGFCFEGHEKLLIYEFVPSTSLDCFIFDPVQRDKLNWGICLRIIAEIALGLFYLHQNFVLDVIQGELKASNILLDAKMNPKISDLGMARLFLVGQTQENTKRMSKTCSGYMAPEYAMHGCFSVKSDVYGFGVFLLEILTGLKNNFVDQLEEGGNLLTYAWRHWKEGTGSQLINPNITVRASSMSEVVRCIQIALLCVQDEPADRPSMRSVIYMIHYFLHVELPSRPSSFVNSETASSIFTGTNQSHSAEQDQVDVVDLMIYPR